MMSGRLSSALRRVPATKPSCTESVSQLAALALRLHSRLSAGTTAEPLNQSDMPSSSAIASSASVRQRDGEASFDEAGFCKREIVTQLAAERRKICSPRRQPWVSVVAEDQPQSGGTKPIVAANVSPSGARRPLLFQLSHGSRHELQIF